MFIKDAENIAANFERIFENNEVESTIEVAQDYIAFSKQYVVNMSVSMVDDALFRALALTKSNYGISVQVYSDETGAQVKLF